MIYNIYNHLEQSNDARQITRRDKGLTSKQSQYSEKDSHDVVTTHMTTMIDLECPWDYRV